MACEASVKSLWDADKRGEPGIVFLARLGSGLETVFLVGRAVFSAGASGGAGFSYAFTSVGETDADDRSDRVGVSVGVETGDLFALPSSASFSDIADAKTEQTESGFLPYKKLEIVFS